MRRAEVTPLSVPGGRPFSERRALMPERSVEETLGEGNYVKIEEGLTDAMAHDEARRLPRRCDVCIGCGLCIVALPARWASRPPAGWPTRRPAGSPTSTACGPAERCMRLRRLHAESR